MHRNRNWFTLLPFFAFFVIPCTLLADPVGDTLHIVGHTRFDSPQPFSSSHSLYYTPEDNFVDEELFLLWFEQIAQDTAPSANVTRYYFAENDTLVPWHTSAIDGQAGPTIGGVIVEQGWPDSPSLLLTHYNNSGDHYFRTILGIENPFVQTFYQFEEYPDPSLGDVHLGNPHAVFGPENFTHTLQSTFSDNPLSLNSFYYLRWHLDEVNWLMVPEQPILITNQARNLSSDIAISENGQHLAIALLLPRDEESGDDDHLRLLNNDLYLYESFDAGETWNTNSPTNITNWLPPDPNLLPDTTYANQDTLRCVRDATLFIDEDDVVHVFFTVAGIDYFRGTTSTASRIFHWDNETEYFIQVADGSELQGRPDETGFSVDSPQIANDVEDDIQYLVFRRVSTVDAPNDTANGYTCADLYMTISSYFNGLRCVRWSMPINLTNTVWESETPMQPGDARSESFPSMLTRTYENDLYLSYLIDQWPGLAEDDTTENTVVLQHMDLMTIIDELYEQWPGGDLYWGFESLRNYPMHIDSTGYYEWDYGSVGEQTNRPETFVLEQNYPNPFNGITRIGFKLGAREQVNLTVYDLLGREVATLLNKPMMPGAHSVSFFSDELPSGIYFYKLTAGNQSEVRKMMLLK